MSSASSGTPAPRDEHWRARRRSGAAASGGGAAQPSRRFKLCRPRPPRTAPPSASLDHATAQAVPSHPRAPPEQLRSFCRGDLRRSPQAAPESEDVPPGLDGLDAQELAAVKAMALARAPLPSPHSSRARVQVRLHAHALVRSTPCTSPCVHAPETPPRRGGRLGRRPDPLRARRAAGGRAGGARGRALRHRRAERARRRGARARRAAHAAPPRRGRPARRGDARGRIEPGLYRPSPQRRS